MQGLGSRDLDVWCDTMLGPEKMFTETSSGAVGRISQVASSDLRPRLSLVASGEQSPQDTVEVAEAMRRSFVKANNYQVDLAQKTFVAKLISVAIMGTMVASSVIAAGVIPVALSSVFVMASIDAGCAYYNWQQKAHGRTALPFEADSVANAVYGLARCFGAPELAAKQSGTMFSAAARAVLMTVSVMADFLYPSQVEGVAAKVTAYLDLAVGLGFQVSTAFSGLQGVRSCELEQVKEEGRRLFEGACKKALTLLPTEEAQKEFKVALGAYFSPEKQFEQFNALSGGMKLKAE